METAEKTKSTFGNIGLVSNEESAAAEYLREHFLDETNKSSVPVHPRKTIYTRFGKRLLDILISFPIFVILFPFNIVFGICTFFDVGHPIFFKQTRIGMNEKTFIMVKFRNMNEKKDKDGKLLDRKSVV